MQFRDGGMGGWSCFSLQVMIAFDGQGGMLNEQRQGKCLVLPTSKRLSLGLGLGLGLAYVSFLFLCSDFRIAASWCDSGESWGFDCFQHGPGQTQFVEMFPQVNSFPFFPSLSSWVEEILLRLTGRALSLHTFYFMTSWIFFASDLVARFLGEERELQFIKPKPKVENFILSQHILTFDDGLPMLVLHTNISCFYRVCSSVSSDELRTLIGSSLDSLKTVVFIRTLVTKNGRNWKKTPCAALSHCM